MRRGEDVKKAAVTALALFAALVVFAPHTMKAVSVMTAEDVTTNVEENSNESVCVTLKKGDFLYFGSYLEEPLLWQVLDVTDGGKILMMTRHVITFKAFDANGAAQGYHESDSALYGSSSWESSSLRQWLNSDDDKVSYSHSAPEKNCVSQGYNSYADEKGFLHGDNFSRELVRLIDGSGVFLLSKEQVSSYFSTGERLKTPTKSALEQSESPYFGSASMAVWYWTSSPVSSNNVSVATVTSSGGYYKTLAFDGLTGVAPAVYLQSSNVICGDGDGLENHPYFVRGGETA